MDLVWCRWGCREESGIGDLACTVKAWDGSKELPRQQLAIRRTQPWNSSTAGVTVTQSNAKAAREASVEEKNSGHCYVIVQHGFEALSFGR